LRTFSLALTLTALLSASPCAISQTKRPTPAADASEYDTSNSEMRPIIERFSADRGLLMRTYTVEASPDRPARFAAFYTDWKSRLAKLNFDAMSQDGQVDYVLFRNLLDHESRRLQLEARDQEEIAAYTASFAPTIVKLEQTRRKMEPVMPQEAAATLTELPKQIEEARRQWELQIRADNSVDAQRKRKILGGRTSAKLNSLRNTLRQWFVFYDGYDPQFTWWTEEAYRAADAALQSYQTFVQERVMGLRAAAPADAGAGRGGANATSAAGGGRGGQGGGQAGGGGRGGFGGSAPAATARAGATDDIVGNPIGRDGLMNELAYEMIPYTPEQLFAIADKEFAWCENEMKRASREMGYGDDWKKALEKVKNTYVEPGKQPEMIRDLEHQAEKFLADHDLIDVPPLVHETWHMEMMSPERQLESPFFLGGEGILVSYPTNTMTYEQKMMSMRGNNPHFSHATVFHELIPGHDLQGFQAARFKAYRSVVGGTPFITEGWALYWELLMWDLDFHHSPEDRIGALFWHMHRCARIIFSLNFHLGKMTPDECINFLVDRVGHERENAVGEVRRSFGGGYGPLYQAAYLLGGMQLYSLHKDLVDSGKMTNRQFHDAVLKENRIPVEMIRASLTKQKLTRDYSSTWKFRGDVP
jgi:uncharacterized protein (DUF885 family)